MDSTPNKVHAGRSPGFLIYAAIYLTCTLPLVVARVASMAGSDVSTGYYCFAGTMIASNGLFDCIIFGSTRHSIVFGSAKDVNTNDTGLETFSFMRTPVRAFGHEVWIQGGSGRGRGDPSVGGWWPSITRGNSQKSGMYRARSRNPSQTSLRGDDDNGMAIHLDVVTTMTVEERRQSSMRHGKNSASEVPSLESMASTFDESTRGVVGSRSGLVAGLGWKPA